MSGQGGRARFGRFGAVVASRICVPHQSAGGPLTPAARLSTSQAGARRLDTCRFTALSSASEMIRFLLFAVLCLVTVAIIRFVRSLGSKPPGQNVRMKQQDRPAVSADEIVDVTYEEFDTSGDEKEVGS